MDGSSRDSRPVSDAVTVGVGVEIVYPPLQLPLPRGRGAGQTCLLANGRTDTQPSATPTRCLSRLKFFGSNSNSKSDRFVQRRVALLCFASPPPIIIVST